MAGRLRVKDKNHNIFLPCGVLTLNLFDQYVFTFGKEGQENWQMNTYLSTLEKAKMLKAHNHRLFRTSIHTFIGKLRLTSNPNTFLFFSFA